MSKYSVTFNVVVDLELDESKFDENFMESFKDYFYDFDSLNEHIEHLAQLYLRGIYDNGSFIEGYGKADNMGIKFHHIDILDSEIDKNE